MQKTSKRVLALVLASIMALSVFSVSVSAASNYDPTFQSQTHTVFKHTEQTLAPGVEYYNNYAYLNDGEQIVYYVTTADVSRDDVVFQIAYKDMQCETYGMAKLTDMVKTANAKYSDPNNEAFISEYYTVVSGTNGNGYNMTTGQPSGAWAMGGTIAQDYTGGSAFFAILKDGSAVMGKTVAEWNAYKADPGIEEAINAFGTVLVWDGADVTANANGSYNTDRHSRTMLGITADGKVVTAVLDGRQSPFSIGGSMHELAQIMLEAGCVYAVNLDGGGSTTFVSRQEGENEVTITNRPSDGSERAISNGILIASLAAPSNVFDRATLTAEDEYVTVNASTTISAKGVSPAGTAADVPAEAYFVTDNGTITAEGVFTPATVGDAVIRLMYNDAVVGETTVHVVVPTKLAFNITTLAVPYGKSSVIDLGLFYGEFDYNVKYSQNDVAFVLSNNAFGTVEDLTFYATSDNTVGGSATITATLVADPTLTSTIPLVVGKGSEVIFDFEDADVSGWSGGDMYNAGVVTTVTAATAETGKVHSGNYSMAYHIDFSQLTYYEDYIASKMCYNADIIAAHGITTDAEGVQQRGRSEDYVDITGAVGLGFWVYLPDEIAVDAFDPDFRIGGKKTATSAWAGLNGYMDDICDSNGLLITNGDSDREGWYYFYFDLSSYSSYYALRLQNCRTSNSTTKNGKTIQWNGDILTWYITDAAWKKAGIKSYNSDLTIYIDDITVDYSSVVADREAPVFGAVTYAFEGASDALTLNNNAVIAYSGLEFSASVAENTAKTNATGINASSVKVFVDGNEVAATYKNGKISVDEISFADGVHTVQFEASDNAGNTSHVTRTFTVNAASGADTVRVVPHDAGLSATKVGSLYYIDVVATDIAKVDRVVTTLKLNNVNDWEPAGIVTAAGFTAAYEIASYDKGVLTLTVTKTGTVSESGEAVIASVPVRTWYPHNALGKDSNWIITSKKCVYPMDTQVTTKAGSVEFTDGTASLFSAAKIQIDSEAMCESGYIGVNKGNEQGTVTVTSWHEHNAQPIEDRAATCTEDGFSGRTYCAECDSVIDWGISTPATGHTFTMIDGVMQCRDCGEIDNRIGLSYDAVDGVWRYIFNGTVQTGWKQINGDWYYFRNGTKAAATGDYWFNQYVTYVFEDNGKLTDGVWVADENGSRYYYGPTYYQHGWVTIGDDTYYFGDYNQGETYRFEGLRYVIESNSSVVQWYDFGTDGKLIGKLDANGLTEINGKLYYFVDGVSQTGLFKVGNDYYFFTAANGYAAVSGNVHFAHAYGEIAAGDYTFGEDGKMILREGFYTENDTLYYYENGVRAKGKGLIELDGYYYYVKGDGSVATGNYYVTNNNGLMPSMVYNFDADGKMILKEGFDTVNSVLYYYENGALAKGKGLFELDGYYYYVKGDGSVATGSYYVTNNNGIMPSMVYSFDEFGRMILKNGFFTENGTLYYYENGVRAKGKGLFKLNADYYYIKGDGSVAIGSYYVTNNNGLMPSMVYNFDADGRMILKEGFFTEGGVLYYYEDGVRAAHKGLFELDGYYYYVKGDGSVATGSYYVTTNNGLMESRVYNFDVDGKMIVE